MSLEFVIDLMLQRGPEIHSHRADLDLHLGLHDLVRQIHRDLHDHMVAGVPAGLGILDVILDGDDMDIPLVPDHFRQLVNIRGERADDADPCDIVDVFDHIVD